MELCSFGKQELSAEIEVPLKPMIEVFIGLTVKGFLEEISG
jgi:hypothetical protein